MSSGYKKQAATKGFTVVEVIVIISVIAILATISIVSIGSWRDGIARSSVQSDLTAAKTAMENARNFGTGYPIAIPSTFKASKDVVVTIDPVGPPADYCIEGKSNVATTFTYIVRGSDGVIVEGTC